MKIITRLKGGLGNQLFCYAAARRLALVNNAELVIDDVTGFTRDRQFEREYALSNFNIPVRKATPVERLEPFERYRRGVMKWFSRRQPFAKRQYLEEEGHDFDDRLLVLKVNGTLYIDGLWQNANYFIDVEQTIRSDLRINPPTDAANQRMVEDIQRSQAVALHVRWFDSPGSTDNQNISTDYYKNAIALIEQRIDSPHYYLFSDNPEAASEKLALQDKKVTVVSHNQGNENAYADLWLMTECSHLILANSTFSWWAAWLNKRAEKGIITYPFPTQNGYIINIESWSFPSQVPNTWIALPIFK